MREALNALDSAVRAALTNTYAAGKARGENIIVQLAEGELGLKDFEKKLSE